MGKFKLIETTVPTNPPLAGVYLMSRKSHFVKYLVPQFEHWQLIVWVYGRWNLVKKINLRWCVTLAQKKYIWSI